MIQTDATMNYAYYSAIVSCRLYKIADMYRKLRPQATEAHMFHKFMTNL